MTELEFALLWFVCGMVVGGFIVTTIFEFIDVCRGRKLPNREEVKFFEEFMEGWEKKND